MRISRKTEYALRALIYIARSGEEGPVQVQELSRAERIPVKFLEQILLTLKNAGVLNSKRGVGGGYTLRRPAAEITSGEVIRLMEGPLAPIPCASPGSDGSECSCPDPSQCSLRRLMTDLRDSLSQLLDARTLEEIIRSTPAGHALVFEI